ncbi:hypothetical protein [Sulfurimonas sp. CS5]
MLKHTSNYGILGLKDIIVKTVELHLVQKDDLNNYKKLSSKSAF